MIACSVLAALCYLQLGARQVLRAASLWLYEQSRSWISMNYACSTITANCRLCIRFTLQPP